MLLGTFNIIKDLGTILYMGVNSGFLKLLDTRRDIFITKNEIVILHFEK